ncbi:MAG: NADH-quinone oxidoreductase subunit N [Polyangiaceae bacterium]|jgi:NADH-quinone oxidoreductase subunit N|nr:NADH-quinone oxidoreductase subunit N [Polyangiaceae bacterium]
MSFELMLALSPVLIVVLGGAALMLVEAMSTKKPDVDESASSEIALGTAMTLLAGAVAALGVWFYGPENLPSAAALAPYFVLDRFTLFFTFVLCFGGALAALLAGGYLPEHRLDRGEFYPLLTFSVVGAIALAAAADLLSLFVALETMSLGVYCLTGFRRGSTRSTEAAVKYFLLGSFAAALTVYGVALIYGATGHTDLAGIKSVIRAFSANAGDPAVSSRLAVLIVGMVLVIAGLGFKISAVPFHMWTPDAYEGAPTPATSFMAVSVKAAAFAMLLRVLIGGFSDPASMSWSAGWPPVLAAFAVLTMTVANVVAGRQESVKRMLAYSSIAHAGYLLVGVVATVRSSADGQGSVLFYLLTYTFSTAGAFGALVLCGSRGKEAVTFEDLAGIGKRHPAAAAVFSLFLLSLAGVPPTAGFFGKLYVVKAALGSELYVLTIVLLLNSVIAAYYYLRVLVYMYMKEPMAGAPIAVPMKSGYVAAALVLAAMAIIGIGLLPGSSLEMAIKAALS